jgi:hypothetical protein
VAYIKLNEEERADFFKQYFNDPDADEEFEGFDEFDIAENIEIVGGIDIEQVENDRDIRDDVEAGWSREDAVPLIAPFLNLSCHTHR